MSQPQSALPFPRGHAAYQPDGRRRHSGWGLLVSTSISLGLLLGPLGGVLQAQTAPPAAAEAVPPPAAPPAPQPPAPQASALPAPPPVSADVLNQTVAPIALYPDALVAQVLAAAAFPSQIAQAEAWLQQHSGLTGDALAQSINGQPWDPSVKALTQFPSVLGSMNQNLAWTVALGIDYGQQPQAVLAAVQTMRQRAEQAGTLEKCTQGEKIIRQGPVIELQPVNPEVVYVPVYDPWVVYGPPVPVYPSWVAVPGAYVTGPQIVFGVGVGIATFAAVGWGWHHWGANWGARNVVFNNHPYVPRAFAGRPGFVGGPAIGGRPGLPSARPVVAGRPGFPGRPGFAAPRAGFAPRPFGRPGFAGPPGGAGRPPFAGRPAFAGPGGFRPGFARAAAGPGGGFGGGRGFGGGVGFHGGGGAPRRGR